MLDNAKEFAILLKEWWELSIAVATAIYFSIRKAYTGYKESRTTAFKVEAIEKLMKESLMTRDECEDIHEAYAKNCKLLHNSCHEMNDLRFSTSVKDSDEIKGHYQKLYARIDTLETNMLNSQSQLSTMILSISQIKEKK